MLHQTVSVTVLFVELVDHGAAYVGGIIWQDKRGAIDASQIPILQRLSIDADTWLDIAATFE